VVLLIGRSSNRRFSLFLSSFLPTFRRPYFHGQHPGHCVYKCPFRPETPLGPSPTASFDRSLLARPGHRVFGPCFSDLIVFCVETEMPLLDFFSCSPLKLFLSLAPLFFLACFLPYVCPGFFLIVERQGSPLTEYRPGCCRNLVKLQTRGSPLLPQCPVGSFTLPGVSS